MGLPLWLGEGVSEGKDLYNWVPRPGAPLGRLTHRIHILEANGESYRLRESRQRLKQSTRTRTAQNTS